MPESIGQWVDIKSLEPWKDNPRQNTKAIDEVAKSIKRFGFASPIVARKQTKMIIAGHTRYAAAMKLGLKKVPVRFMDLDLNDAQLLALADNKIGELADWDAQKLKDVIVNLQDQNLDGLGWSEDELACFFTEQTDYNDIFDEHSIEDIEEEQAGHCNQVNLFFSDEEFDLFCENLNSCKALLGVETREDVLLAVLDAYINKRQD
tara:strand:+ start:2006 stop:2620 length:615 start_codon:yes stop_codon:yes gene_type:complete